MSLTEDNVKALKEDAAIGKPRRWLMRKIKQQEREIDDLQKENEALKATIAREKVASIELENIYIKELNSVQSDYSYQKDGLIDKYSDRS